MLSESFHGEYIREMTTVIGKLNKSVIAAATLFFGCTSVLAADVSLSEIEISSSANNGYDIVLKTNKKTDIKKTLKGDNQLVIELKNTEAATDFSTIYNEISTINNVTIMPMGKDDLKIQIQGSEISNSNVKLNYASTELTTQAQNFDPNQINLSLPMENYKPVYDESEFEEEEPEANIGGTLAGLNPIAIAQKIKNKETENSAEPNNFKWMSYLGLGLILLTAAKNILKPTKEASIGLTQNLKEREKELAEKFNNSVKESLSLRSKIAQNATAPSINYGLKAYQNAQRNPYQEAPATLRPIKKEVQNYIQKPTQKAVTSIPKTVTPVRQTTMSTQFSKNSSVNVDSKKFLESMTKIYEKNGRADLAMGLKNNMKKVNI